MCCSVDIYGNENLYETKALDDRCQVIDAVGAASHIAETLEPKIIAAVREGAESVGVGEKRGRGGGGALGASGCWLIVPFCDLLGESPWRCEDRIPVQAAHLACGGPDQIPKPDFEREF